MKIIAGTGNKHKIAEFAEILAPLKISVIPLSELGSFPEVEENGTSFEENAAIKALATAKFAYSALLHNDFLALADDSGLEVLALNGRPGIHSARYADTNDKRIARVLAEMQGINDRRARFVCVIALATPKGVYAKIRGEVTGTLMQAPRGTAGFGYDPIFVPDGYTQTFAELGMDIKNKISHRSKALRLAADFIANFKP